MHVRLIYRLARDLADINTNENAFNYDLPDALFTPTSDWRADNLLTARIIFHCASLLHDPSLPSVVQKRLHDLFQRPIVFQFINGYIPHLLASKAISGYQLIAIYNLLREDNGFFAQNEGSIFILCSYYLNKLISASSSSFEVLDGQQVQITTSLWILEVCYKVSD